MQGTANKLITSLIAQRSRGNPTFADTTRVKLILKGINPDKYTPTTPDEPSVLVRVRAIAAEYGIQL